MIMRRNQFIVELQDSLGISPREASEYLSLFEATLTEAICRGEEVALTGIGRLKARWQRARKTKTIDGKTHIPAKWTVRYSPSRSFSIDLNSPRSNLLRKRY
jgi:nucleoid DNA-binding protein